MTGDPQPPDPTGWISAADAAARLGRAVRYVAGGHSNGHFPVTRHDDASWLLESDVDRILEERQETEQRWVTRADVQEWAGCSNGTLDLAITRGEIELRPGPRTRGMPSLDRASARSWATAWASRRAERARRQAETDARMGPPDAEHVWLDTNTAAAIVGMRPRNLLRLAQLSRAPATKHGAWWWWRRDLVEAYAAARVAGQRSTHTENR